MGELGIQYKPIPTINGQALVDFIVECCFKRSTVVTKSQPVIIISPIKPKTLVEHSITIFIWELYVDGSSNIDGNRDGIILVSHEEQVSKYTVCFEFLTTNKVLMYKALLEGSGFVEALNAYPL